MRPRMSSRPPWAEAAGLGDQRFDIGNVAEPELHHGKGEQILRIIGIKLEGLLEEGERALIRGSVSAP